MSGAIPLLHLYAFMAYTQTTLMLPLCLYCSSDHNSMYVVQRPSLFLHNNIYLLISLIPFFQSNLLGTGYSTIPVINSHKQ
jgi:hypothetical protein